MKLIIEIEDEKYEWIKEHKDTIDFKTTEILYSSIRNAKPFSTKSTKNKNIELNRIDEELFFMKQIVISHRKQINDLIDRLNRQNNMIESLFDENISHRKQIQAISEEFIKLYKYLNEDVAEDYAKILKTVKETFETYRQYGDTPKDKKTKS